MKRLLVFSVLLLVALAPAAYASNPNHPGGCHGANNVPCRPDPQPTHGNDCQNSDDHSCDVTTTTTTRTAPTTTTMPTATTTPTVPTVRLSPTSTTTSSPSVVSIPETGSPSTTSDPAAHVTTPTVGFTSTDELPATGAGGTLYLLAIGLILIMFGTAAWLAGRA